VAIRIRDPYRDRDPDMDPNMDPNMDPDPDPYRDTSKTCLGGGMHCPNASSCCYRSTSYHVEFVVDVIFSNCNLNVHMSLRVTDD